MSGEVVNLGVPWWSGVTFVAAGSVAIYLDKRCTLKILQVCLLVSVAATVLSVVAVIIYSVDMSRNPEVPCVRSTRRYCNDHHYASRLSRGVKSTLLLFTLTQAIISTILTIQLYKQKRVFGPYATLANTSPPTTPTATTPPERH
ncbi:transmembrane protein 176 isoform 2-T2 [Synchiropus picturatus]